MASLFPKVRRLLYLDNDVVVSCCLEEIYYSAELNKVTSPTTLTELPLSHTSADPTVITRSLFIILSVPYSQS